MTHQQLFEFIKTQKSYLCVGLDTDITKIPAVLHTFPNPVFEFNKQIIEATAPYCVAYKINTAFYEAQGSKGWHTLEQTIAFLNQNYPTHFTIADAKRGDIGNTATQYANAFFTHMNFDAVTIAPYMGKDSVVPFLEHENKWGIVLALTSNPGSEDFEEMLLRKNGQKLYEEVLIKTSGWGNENNTMYVVGATKAEMLKDIRQIIKNHFILVPGVGAQGGSLKEVSKYGLNKWCGLLVNSSRAIIYASKEKDFAFKAAKEAQKIQADMEKLLDEYMLY